MKLTAALVCPWTKNLEVDNDVLTALPTSLNERTTLTYELSQRLSSFFLLFISRHKA